MQQNILITGNSSGLGYGLTEAYLTQGSTVYGLSRRGCANLSGKLHDVHCDLSKHDQIALALQILLDNVEKLDVVYLNAGIFGELTHIADFKPEQLNRIMDINVWENKFILDWLLSNTIRITQVIAISSGAALSANKGWAGYSLSKIALNKLIEHYATEFTSTHFIALAPGLIDTAMQDYLCDETLELGDEFPGLEKFRQARGTETMPSPRRVAQSIIDILPSLQKLPSGGFTDLRNL